MKFPKTIRERFHAARHLRSNLAISPSAVQRFELRLGIRLIDYLIKLPPLPSDD